MIRIVRCDEPVELQAIRDRKLDALRGLGREPSSGDITGYSVVSLDLWRAQHRKCCYCETKVMKAFNDVEHYRPKGAADRLPGSLEVHGYWWLAYSWENLLFACPSCNRTGKNSRFPLELGGGALTAESTPPGCEVPLLLDPSVDEPSVHIQYVYCSVVLTRRTGWFAIGRNVSKIGDVTVDVCDLNRGELLELRDDHVEEVVLPQVAAVMEAIDSRDLVRIRNEVYRCFRMFGPRCAYSCLTFDCMTAYLDTDELSEIVGFDWPSFDGFTCAR